MTPEDEFTVVNEIDDFLKDLDKDSMLAEDAAELDPRLPESQKLNNAYLKKLMESDHYAKHIDKNDGRTVSQGIEKIREQIENDRAELLEERELFENSSLPLPTFRDDMVFEPPRDDPEDRGEGPSNRNTRMESESSNEDIEMEDPPKDETDPKESTKNEPTNEDADMEEPPKEQPSKREFWVEESHKRSPDEKSSDLECYELDAEMPNFIDDYNSIFDLLNHLY